MTAAYHELAPESAAPSTSSSWFWPKSTLLTGAALGVAAVGAGLYSYATGDLNVPASLCVLLLKEGYNMMTVYAYGASKVEAQAGQAPSTETLKRITEGATLTVAALSPWIGAEKLPALSTFSTAIAAMTISSSVLKDKPCAKYTAMAAAGASLVLAGTSFVVNPNSVILLGSSGMTLSLSFAITSWGKSWMDKANSGFMVASIVTQTPLDPLNNLSLSLTFFGCGAIATNFSALLRHQERELALPR